MVTLRTTLLSVDERLRPLTDHEGVYAVETTAATGSYGASRGYGSRYLGSAYTLPRSRYKNTLPR
eukprot:5845556-Pyramimonas_sp.AAC.3